MKNDMLKQIEEKILSDEQVDVLKRVVFTEFKEAFINQGLSEKLFEENYKKITTDVANKIATNTQMVLLQQATFAKVANDVDKNSKKKTAKKPGPKTGAKKKKITKKVKK